MQVSLSFPILLHKASKKVNSLGRRPSQHKPKLVLCHPRLPSQPSFHNSLPKLHGVAKELDTHIVATCLHVALVLVNGNDFTKPSLIRHLCA
ncbi:hypothetical protein Tco_0338422 [Tanacetum coccineum]